MILKCIHCIQFCVYMVFTTPDVYTLIRILVPLSGTSKLTILNSKTQLFLEGK